MGWPVYPVLAETAGIRPFEFPDVKRGHRYAGNAYQVSTFGMWMVTVLACLKIVQVPDNN